MYCGLVILIKIVGGDRHQLDVFGPASFTHLIPFNFASTPLVHLTVTRRRRQALFFGRGIEG